PVKKDFDDIRVLLDRSHIRRQQIEQLVESRQILALKISAHDAEQHAFDFIEDAVDKIFARREIRKHRGYRNASKFRDLRVRAAAQTVGGKCGNGTAQ